MEADADALRRVEAARLQSVVVVMLGRCKMRKEREDEDEEQRCDDGGRVRNKSMMSVSAEAEIAHVFS